MIPSRSPYRPRQMLALEARVLLDAATLTTAAEVAKSVAASDTAPGVEATPTQATLTITDSSDSFPAVDLFSAVHVSGDGSGEALSSLVITVSNSSDKQALLIDGSSVVLGSSGSGTTTDNGYYYSVSVSGEITTITVSIASSDANSASDVETLIDGIKYSALDKTLASGNVAVTLATLSDESDTATLAISSTITIDSRINVAPVLSDSSALAPAESYDVSDLGSNFEVVYSADATHAYVAGDGAISAYAVDASGRLTLLKTVSVDVMGDASEMLISADGKSIYVIDGSSSVYVFDVGDDGKLGNARSITTDNGDITGGLAISDDGAYVYAGTQWNDVVIFSRDADSGTLIYLDRAPGESGSNSRNGVIVSAGDYVYVIYTDGSHTLLVYTRNNDGTLSTAATLITDTWGYSAVDYSLDVSTDGRYLYVADPENGTISVYQFSGNSLTLLEALTVDNVSSLALSDDGGLLFATASDGTISVFTLASDGRPTLASSLAASSGAGDIAVSGDGLSILVASSAGITRYSLAQALDQDGTASTFADGITLADSNADALGDGSGNYKGASITVSASVAGGSFGFTADGDLSYASGVISLGGNAIATCTVDGQVLTVTFTADVSTATANRVVQRLNYQNDGATAGSYITLSVSASDGALSGNTLLLTLRANAVPTIDGAVATGYALAAATSETAYSHTLDSGLFSDADGDRLILSVSGLPAGLSFDSTTRTISGTTNATGSFTLTVSASDASGASSSLSLELIVGQIDNRSPQLGDSTSTTLATATQDGAYSATLDSGLFTDADAIYGDTLSWSVSGLPDGLSFDAATLTISGTAAVIGSYTVTVTVSDEAGASLSTALTLRVVTLAEADNSAPSVEVAGSALTYTVDGALSGFGQYVYDLELSADDGTLLVVGNGSAAAALTPSGNSTLYVYSRDGETDTLTLSQKFVQGSADDGDDSNGIEVDGLIGATSVLYSADGQYAYTVGKNSAGSYVVTAFGVAGDGSLTLTELGTAVGSAQIKQIVAADDGDTLYAVAGSSVYSLSVAADGALTLAGTYGETSGTTAVAIDVDSEGTVYVLSSGSAQLTVYTTNDDSTLTYVGKLTRSGTTLTYTDASGNATVAGTLTSSSGFNTARSFAVADDGTVYIVTGTYNYLTILRYDDGSNSMALVSSASTSGQLGSTSSQAWSVAVSDDGSTLYVGGSLGTVGVYAINDDGSVSHTGAIAATGGRGLRLAVSADGSSVYTGGYAYSTGLGQASSDGTAALAYTEGTTIVLAGGLSISDADYDALAGSTGDYSGAILSVVRSGGADPDDSYGFADGNGLTLSDGTIYLDGTAIATFSSNAGTLTVTFSAGVSTATANQLLRQITYTSTSNNPDSSITLLLSVGDQYTRATAALQLTVTQINDVPTLTSTALNPTYSEGGAAVSLFGGTSVSTGEDGQSLRSLSLIVAGVGDGAQETLTIDGTAIALFAGSGSTSSGYRYTVSVDSASGDVTVKIASDSGIAVANFAALVDGISYANSGDDPGQRTVTLSSVQDSGGGTDAATLGITATIGYLAINDAPTASATAAHTFFTENASAVTLFSGASVSTIEDGQAISGLTLTISGVVDGQYETLTVDGTPLALVAGSGTTDSAYAYTITVSGTTVSLTISSSDGGITPQAAAALIDGIAYANLSDVPGTGTRSISLTSIQDNGGNERGGSDTGTLAIAASVDVLAANDAPQATAVASNANYLEGQGSFSLFSDSRVSTVESGQSISELTLVVSGVGNGQLEVLIIDNTRIALIAGSGTTSSGLGYTVTSEGDTLKVTITSSNGIDPASAAVLIDGMAYVNDSSDPAEGSRSFTLTAISDNGGNANGGSDSAPLSITATANVAGINQAPSLSSTPTSTTYQASGDAGLLFDATRIDCAESGQGILALTLEVSGIVDDGEQLVIDGSPITLIDGNSYSTSHGLSVSVSVVDGRATLQISSAEGLSTSDAQALVDSIAYRNVSDTVSVGTRSVTLTAIRDDGGSSNGGTDSTPLAISTTISVINSVPRPTDTAYRPASIEVASAFAIVLPADLFEDADGDALTWSVSGLPDGLSFDAQTRTISGSVGNAGSYAITLVASDPDGASATRSVTLSIVDAVKVVSTPVATQVGGTVVWQDSLAAGAAGPTPALAATGVPAAMTAAPTFVAATAGTAPLTSDPLQGGDAPTALPSARSTLALLDALSTRRDEAPAQRLTDGRATVLVAQAETNAADFAASVAALRGSWQADVAGNRQIYTLPHALFVSREPVARLTLRLADGRPLPANLRLDIESGQIIRSGWLGGEPTLHLELQLQDADGRTLTIPLTLDAPAASGDATGQTPPADPDRSGKAALTRQLREHGSSDLYARARDLLARIGASAAVDTRDLSTTTPERPSAPLHATVES